MTTLKSEKLLFIAHDCGIPTLKERGRDDLDFHDLSVFWINQLLDKAYEAGFEAAVEMKGHRDDL